MRLPKIFGSVFTAASGIEISIGAIRRRILANLLAVVGVLFSLIVIPLVIYLYQRGQVALLAGIAVTYLLGIPVAFSPRISHQVKVLTTLVFFYAGSILALFQMGLKIESGLVLLTFTVITGLFVGMRGFLSAQVLSVLSMIILWLLAASGRLAASALPLQESGAGELMRALVTYISASTILSFSHDALISSLQNSLNTSQELIAEVDSERLQLRQRTVTLERRDVQIRTAAAISRSISALLDPQELMQRVVRSLQEGFDLYYAGVFLLDDYGRYAVLSAGTGKAGEAMLAEGHRLKVGGDSMIGWSTAYGKPRIALNVVHEDIRFRNPHLPKTRSEMALPILASGRVLGALTIQSTDENAFDEEDIVILQGVADSLATALENARLFQELQSSLEEVKTLQQQMLADAWIANPAMQELAFEYQPAPHARPPQEEAEPPGVLEVPLALRGQIIGKLTVELEPGDLTEDKRQIIDSIATEAALALENARLLAETQQTARRDRALADISSKIWSSPDIETILRTTLRELGKQLNIEDGSITLDIGQPGQPPEQVR